MTIKVPTIIFLLRQKSAKCKLLVLESFSSKYSRQSRNWIHLLCNNNLSHIRPNQVTFGSKSLKATGPQIWNCLPNELKSADNLNSFKRMIKQWDGPSCQCNVCKFNHTLQILSIHIPVLLKFSIISINFFSYFLSFVI